MSEPGEGSPDPVTDDELLLRSVAADLEHHYSEDGRLLQLASTTFNDKKCQPSVDRLKLRESPEAARMSPTDGVAELKADKVRALKVSAQGQAVLFADVVEDRLPENPSHALIVGGTRSTDLTGSQFKRLKAALVRIATVIVQPTRSSASPPGSGE